MPQLTEMQRHQAIGLLQDNVSLSAVARKFNVKRKAVRKLGVRFQTNGTVKDAPRTGRTRVTTNREDNLIRTTHLWDRFRPASKTAHEWQGVRNISRHTVRLCLKSFGITCQRPTSFVTEASCSETELGLVCTVVGFYNSGTCPVFRRVKVSPGTPFWELPSLQESVNALLLVVSVNPVTDEVLWSGEK